MSQMTIEIKRTPHSRIAEIDFDNLTFGEQFSDHMLEVRYSEGSWREPMILPYGQIPMYPAVSTLHYGQAVFEGMKAFRYNDGKVNIFRLDKHYERFRRSCERVCIPEVSEEVFTEGMKKLVTTDRDWVPNARYKSLYIRPIVFASDQTLGLRASRNYRFYIICSPVGNYYAEGIKPIRLTTMPKYVRAVLGGVGDVKVPGNYAASLQPTTKAQQLGYTQVLWLDAIEHKYVEEVGSMNIFFVIDDVLVTPPLNGSILPGITRNSVIELAKIKGMPVEQRPVTIDELADLHKNARLKEIFGAGTAAVISPVGLIHHEDYQISFGTNEMGPVSRWFYDNITGIQHGDISDPGGWCTLL
jgi:branched-chain amino acid aminotransferase